MRARACVCVCAYATGMVVFGGGRSRAQDLGQLGRVVLLVVRPESELRRRPLRTGQLDVLVPWLGFHPSRLGSALRGCPGGREVVVVVVMEGLDEKERRGKRTLAKERNNQKTNTSAAAMCW